MNLVFDIFPADDVRGTRLVRLTSDDYLQGTMFRTELVGMGKGRLVLQADQAVVTAANLARDNYVEVFDLTLSGAYALGAFFLEEGDFAALSSREQAGRILTFGGRGELSYLSRGVLGPTALSGAAGPLDQHWIDTLGSWKWGSLGSETYGAILRRIIYESALMTPDPLPEVQLVDIGWDDVVDSDAVPWPGFTGEYDIPVGTNLLQAVADLLKYGIELVPNSDFEYTAYNAGTYGTDRTSATFATNKVRFEAGVNIAADLSRAIHGATDASHALLKDRTGFAFELITSPEYTAGDVVRYVGITSPESTGPDDLVALGEGVLTNRRDFVDQFAFPHPTGYTPLSGLYTPGPPASAAHYWKGDFVTIHTGTSPYDANEQTIRVAAIEWNVDDAGNWLPTVELGAQYLSIGQANLQNQLSTLVSSPHTHPPNPELCRIGHAATPVSERYYFSTTPAAITPQITDAAWADTASTAIRTLIATPDSTYTGGNVAFFDAPGTAVGNYQALHSFSLQITGSDLLAAVQAGGMELAAQIRCKSKSGVGVNEAAQNNIYQWVWRVYRAGTGFVGTMLAAHAAGSGTKFSTATPTNITFSGTAASVAGAALNDYLLLELGTRHLGPTSGGAGASMHPTSISGGSDLPVDEATTSNLNSWVQLTQTGDELVGDLPLDTVRQDEETTGTSIRAARCDHQHAHGLLSADGDSYHELSQLADYVVQVGAPPTVTDDAGDGYSQGSIWIDSSTGDVYILSDPTEGAAVWLPISGGEPTRRWEAVTNGTDVFVWEGADLVHEWKEY